MATSDNNKTLSEFLGRPVEELAKNKKFARELSRWTSSSAPTSLTIDGFQKIGSPAKAEILGRSIMDCNASRNLSNQQLGLMAVNIAKKGTFTGVLWYMAVQGAYTANNNNKLGLYSYNLATGGLTLVASSANNGNLWKASSLTWVSTPFTSPIELNPGVYFIASLYCNNGESTAPAMLGGTSVFDSSLLSLGSTNTTKIYGLVAGQTDLPASLNMSSVTRTQFWKHSFLY